MQLPRSSRAWSWAIAIAATCLGLVFVRTAWLSDDVHITLRTVDNLLNGYGPVWNAGERVQSYTHPLWMLLLTASCFVSGEYYYAPILLSLAVSTAAVLLFLRLSRTPVAAILALTGLLLSRAFIDYSSSGLENPLTHLLLALFVTVFWAEKRERRLLWMALLTGLGALNRMDTVLLFAPALALTFWEQREKKALAIIALGFTPFFAWELFSLLYYGFPFPNTAYAKLGSGIPRSALIWQGVLYVRQLLLGDPVTAILIAAGLQAALMLRERRSLAVAGGIFLYVIYTVWIGGDFMLGRFFAAPAFVAAMLIARLPLLPRPRAHWIGALGTLLVVGVIVCPYPPPLSGSDYGNDRTVWFYHGVVDERAWYFPDFGLIAPRPSPPAWARDAYSLRDQPERVFVKDTIGMFGLVVGPSKHIIDPWALADPLLARLPSREKPDWRIGHFERGLPAGYVDSVRSGENRIEDPALARYYDDLLQAVRAPLFSLPRFRAILDLNLGRRDQLIDSEVYRHYPNRRFATLEPKGAGVWEWRAGEAPWLVPADGIELTFDGAQTFAAIEVGTLDAGVALVQFRRAGASRAALVPGSSADDLAGNVAYTCIDQLASRAGWPYQAIHLFSGQPDWRILWVRALAVAPPGYCTSRFGLDRF